MSGRRYFPSMYFSGASVVLLPLLLDSLVVLVSAKGSNGASPWKTLAGGPPLVVARGGFSGLFPDSSAMAYTFALSVSVPDAILWCDVQLTKDGVGICLPDLRLENSTDITVTYKKRDKVYLVNGVPTNGWFTVDFTLKDLNSVSLNQGVYSRTNKFDGNTYRIRTVQDVAGAKPPGLWLNIQHDVFFTQFNLSMRNLVLSVSRSVVVSYISSPEVAFLRSIRARFNPRITKLILRVLEPEDLEPTTNLTYRSLLSNLTLIKTFASGILVPKFYIWPEVNSYIQPHTSLVSDAHKEGLEVFASEFYNDIPVSYNYSYDPVSEILNYIDNGDFSVDGLLSDFPLTPSAVIDCFAHLGKNDKPQATLLVISKFGASGDYPGCTDLAYRNAIADGVDVLDCPVQMSKDGVPFCLSSINLIDSTIVPQTTFSSLTKTIPAIKAGSGIFAFDLTWGEIKNLSHEWFDDENLSRKYFKVSVLIIVISTVAAISSPFSQFMLFRNSAFKNKGTFLTLSNFLALTKNTSSLSGVLISIEHAAYLAKERGLSVTDAVLNALSKAGYDNKTTQRVMIRSTNSSVLMKFKGKSNYDLVYEVDENIRDALNATIADIKSFADAVVISKSSVFPLNSAFLTGVTNVVPKLQSFKLLVYVETFSNEFVSQAWDFLSDATVEINSFVQGVNIDGIITDFPKTSARYKRNRCLGTNPPAYMGPVAAGGLIQLITPQYLPPAAAPYPVLTVADVAESPLSPVSEIISPTQSIDGGSNITAPNSPNGQPKITACFFLLNLLIILAALFLF